MCLLNFPVSIQSCIFTWKKFPLQLGILDGQGVWGQAQASLCGKSLPADRSCGEITAPQVDTTDAASLLEVIATTVEASGKMCACTWSLPVDTHLS